MKLLSSFLSMGLLSAALLLAASTRATAQEHTFTTLAGPAEAGSGDADGPGSLARFRTPYDVAVDSADNVYVADTQNHTIRKMTPAGVVTTVAGLARNYGTNDGTGSAARFYLPYGMTVDSAGNVYVADTGNSTLRKVTPGGVVTTLAGLAGSDGGADGTGSAARFYGPGRVAVDSAGNLYIADYYTLRKVTPGGVVTTLAGAPDTYGSDDGTGSAARFYGACGLAVDSAGNVYVADTGNHTLRKVTPGGVVTTLAGTAGSSGGDDGTGSAARFKNPYDLAVDSAGNVYVADTGNHTIRKVTPGGAVTTLAGSAGSIGSDEGTGSAARFNYPRGVAADSAGNLYVADSSNYVIRKVTPAGVVTTLAGVARSYGSSADGTGSEARFYNPYGAAVDGAGIVYVADMANNTLRKVTPAGVVTTLAGLAGSIGSDDGTGSAARFYNPFSVAADSAGNVYVADTRNFTIRKVTPAGIVTTLAGLAGYGGSTDGLGSAARFYCPWGVAVDSTGTVYVADSNNHTIRKVTPGGWVTTLAGLAGSAGSDDGTGSEARFKKPYGVAVDSAGNVYVADYGNHTIRKVTPGGVVTTLAGLAGSDGSTDGTGSAARFMYPDGVAVDSAGNVYVADTFNSTIRKITPGGVVTTLAGAAGRFPLSGGTSGYGGSADGTGLDARFGGPGGVAVDSAGNLYVADSGNHTIRLGRPACPDAPTIDLATGFVGQARQLDTSPQSALAWQWRLVRIPAASALASWSANVRNPTFTPDVADLFVFQLTATNAAGQVAIRTLALSAVPAPPQDILWPLAQTVESGSTACLRVAATNSVPGTTYQWYFNGSPLSGATGARLALTNIQPAQAGAYTVALSSANGLVTSTPASLRVIAPVPRSTVTAIYLTAESGNHLHLEYRDGFGPGNAWLPLADFAVTNTPQLCLDLPGPPAAQRFYRAWQANTAAAPPRLELGLATQIPLTGTLGRSVRIDYLNAIGPSDAWVTLATVRLTNSPQLYFDLTAFRQAPRLYRLVRLPY